MKSRIWMKIWMKKGLKKSLKYNIFLILLFILLNMGKKGFSKNWALPLFWHKNNLNTSKQSEKTKQINYFREKCQNDRWTGRQNDKQQRIQTYIRWKSKKKYTNYLDWKSEKKISYITLHHFNFLFWLLWTYPCNPNHNNLEKSISYFFL